MNASLILALLLLAAGIIIIILVFRGMADSSGRRSGKGSTVPQGPKSICPVCCSPLEPGRQLITKVYKGSALNEKSCSIYGCPRCYPVPMPGIQRSCPVCHAALLPSSYLVAHLFMRDENKNHVHVSGCINCCSGARGRSL